MDQSVTQLDLDSVSFVRPGFSSCCSVRLEKVLSTMRSDAQWPLWWRTRWDQESFKPRQRFKVCWEKSSDWEPKVSYDDFTESWKEMNWKLLLFFFTFFQLWCVYSYSVEMLCPLLEENVVENSLRCCWQLKYLDLDQSVAGAMKTPVNPSVMWQFFIQ